MKLSSCLFLVLLFTVFTTVISTEDNEDDVPQGDSEAEQKQKEEHLKDGAFALAGAAAALVGAANPLAGATIAIGTIGLQLLLKNFEGSTGDMWDKLEDRIDIKIGSKLASARVSDLKKEVLYPLNRRILKGAKFGPEDLDEILDRMPLVIPGNKELGWNYDLPLAMVYYVPYMIAGYHKMINEHGWPSCGLANDMQVYRSNVINGCKEMMRKRYKSIYGESDVYSRVDCRKRGLGRLGGGGSSRGGQCIDRILTYADTVGIGNKKDFKMALRGGKFTGLTFKQEIGIIQKHAVDFLFKEIVQKINTFFTPEICLKNLGCTCPKPIKRSDIDFGYPNDCYGNTQCASPASKFDKGYYYCRQKNVASNPILKTNKVNFDICMPVKQEAIEPLNLLDDI